MSMFHGIPKTFQTVMDEDQKDGKSIKNYS